MASPPEAAPEAVAPTVGAPAAPPDGLSAAEARHRLETFGRNEVAEAAPASWRQVLAKFWAPVPWMLEVAIVLQLALGETVEAAVIAALLVFNAVLGLAQERRAQATLDALKSRLALTASVRRDGAWQTVPVAELVPGDTVKLSLGGIVGADVRLVAGAVLLDQSMLTGESLPVEGGPGTRTYAGALVRRGEAVAEVTATGPRTRFGRTAELVRTAHAATSQQQAVLRVVRNLALFNGAVVLVQVAYAASLGLPVPETIQLMLTAVLAAIPVALPATFTLATAIGARALARQGVLPTRLSAVDEAAMVDVLCADKTGTLTRNELAVAAVQALPGFDAQRVLALAALASAEGGQDPVDGAIRTAAAAAVVSAAGAGDPPARVRFVPFDPASKMSEAWVTGPDGGMLHVVKGAFARVAGLAAPSPAAEQAAAALAAEGHRVLAVASGPGDASQPGTLRPDAMQIVGLVALSDPPRADSAALIAELRRMGVGTVMVTGDAPATAAVVARAVGLMGEVCPPGPPPESLGPDRFAVFAGVFPEDKFHIVRAFQDAGHAVAMCGDGANDAPALRQAQMGIAVSTATDIAKSAAGIVLTEPGLGGIVAAVREGRVTFQRILTYALRSLTGKINQLLFLTVGLLMTGHAILTPVQMVLVLTVGDFLAMASTTDRVRPSALPNRWRIDTLTVAAIALGLGELAFCSAVLALGRFGLGFGIDALRTLSILALVFGSQGVLYVVRERRRLWRSRPSGGFMLATVADILTISVLAGGGVLMAPLPPVVIGAVLAAATLFTLALDQVKVAVFRRLKMV